MNELEDAGFARLVRECSFSMTMIAQARANMILRPIRLSVHIEHSKKSGENDAEAKGFCSLIHIIGHRSYKQRPPVKFHMAWVLLP